MPVDDKLITNRIFILLLLCYPAILLTVRGGMNTLFFLMLIPSLFYLFRTPGAWSKAQWDRHTVVYALAMASPMLAVFISQAYHGSFSAPPYDGPSRYLLAVPIMLALRQTGIRTIAVMQYGLPLGTLVGLSSMLVWPYEWGGNKFTTGQFLNLIHFSDIALTLGFLSFFSINWTRRDPASVIILKVLGLLAGLYMSIQSGERGGWLAIPVLALIWFASHKPKRPWLVLSIASVAVLCISLLSYALIDVVHNRVNNLFQDLADYGQGNKDTSIGVRLQLWQAAIHIFLEHPVFGVGPGGFAELMGPLSESGAITPHAAQLGRGEVHNEILAKAAGLGLAGLISILAIYLAPLAVFLRAARSSAAATRTAAFMGICVVAGFFIYGLTVEIFNLKMTAAFYSLTVAILLAAATSKTVTQDNHV